ncbi:MAG TPA: type I methionyl aminopeptidase [Bacteroidota bacterium]|nr:type I methionyl aminopeptidase [Bacteroidota bacterium]
MAKVGIKSEREITLMRESGKIVGEVLNLVGSLIRAGVTTEELDRAAEEYIRAQGGVPAFKGYGSDKRNLFPATLCVSIDDVVVHGIPGGQRLEEGQIVSIDVGVKKNGYFGDGARTFPVGRVSDERERLMKITEEALYQGIRNATEGKRLHDISSAVQRHVEEAGFSVVRDLVGHGIGKNLHEDPAVPNFGVGGTGLVLQAGMTLAIEPMVNAGTYRVMVDADGWTVRTTDGRPSAHFEHSVVVRPGEADILTR